MIKFLVLLVIALFGYGASFPRMTEPMMVGIFAALYWTGVYGITYYQIKWVMKFFGGKSERK